MIQNCGYLSELHDKLLRDALVFGIDSDIVRKKCIAERNNLTLKKAREITRTDEATRLQLQAMKSEVDTTHVNSLHRAKGNAKPKQRGQRDNKARKQRNIKQLSTDAAMSPTRATTSVQLAVLNATIATNAAISARFAGKETKCTKYKTIQLVNKKITLTCAMMICSWDHLR